MTNKNSKIIKPRIATDFFSHEKAQKKLDADCADYAEFVFGCAGVATGSILVYAYILMYCFKNHGF